MMLLKISHQRAFAICKKEGIPFDQIKECGPYLLKTGVKISYSKYFKSYVIYGYAYDDSDVNPYIKTRK
jgi:hypothetical protein